VASAGLYASLHLIPDNHANIPPLSFLQSGCPSCRPTSSVKALKEYVDNSGQCQTIHAVDTNYQYCWTSAELQWTACGPESVSISVLSSSCYSCRIAVKVSVHFLLCCVVEQKLPLSLHAILVVVVVVVVLGIMVC